MHLVVRAALCAAVLLPALATEASAGTRDRILRDCVDDQRIDGDYSAAELRDARNNIPAYIDEYSDCRHILRRAELAMVADDRGASGTAPGPDPVAPPAELLTPSTPAEQELLRLARSVPPAALVRGGRLPGIDPFATTAPRHDLPQSLLAALAAMVLLGVLALADARARARSRS